MRDRCLQVATRRKIHEDYEVSCRVLAELIPEFQARQQLLVIRDFLTKCRYVRPDNWLPSAVRFLNVYAPAEVSKLTSSMATMQVTSKRRADVALITIIPEELRAAKLALGIGADEEPLFTYHHLRFWETSLRQTQPGRDLKVVLTMVAEQRNVPCAIASTILFQTYEPSLAILLGIAGGLRTKVKVGDVVVPRVVLDYEGTRQEPDGAKKRFLPYKVDPQTYRDVNYFNLDTPGWREHVRSCLERVEASLKPDLPEDWKPQVHREVVLLAGEKLLADESLPEMQREYHDLVRAVEMEGSGFSRACEEHGCPWLVFRGVSDYGGIDKPNFEKWKITAALGAACAAKAFLETVYVDSERKEF
jgi:nucleoside phosphorylase